MADRRDRLRRPGRSKAAMSSGLTRRTLVVGLGARTNPIGIRQLECCSSDSFEDVIVVPLPDYPGQHDVMHLMSLVSPIDHDLGRRVPDAVARTRFGGRSWIAATGCRSARTTSSKRWATNVLALGPRDCVMLEGNPKTRAALERRAHAFRSTKAGDQPERRRRADVSDATAGADGRESQIGRIGRLEIDQGHAFRSSAAGFRLRKLLHAGTPP